MTASGCPVRPGCPIRRSPDHSLFGDSPELIAACHVLHRLRTPRHPPCTLRSLTTFMNPCGPATAACALTFQNNPQPSALAPAAGCPEIAAVPAYFASTMHLSNSSPTPATDARLKPPASSGPKNLCRPPDAVKAPTAPFRAFSQARYTARPTAQADIIVTGSKAKAYGTSWSDASAQPRRRTARPEPRTTTRHASGTHRPGKGGTGADRDRTGNLRVANAALSRLSYGPVCLPAVRPAAEPARTAPRNF